MLANLLNLLVVVTGSTSSPVLNDETYSKWRDYIRPKKEEVCFEGIPWRPIFWEGVLEAQQKNMPILIFAMNGHPLACT